MALWRYCVREYPGVTGFSLGAFGGLAVYEATGVIYRFLYRRIGDDLFRVKPDKYYLLRRIKTYKEADVQELEDVGRAVEAKLKVLRESRASRANYGSEYVSNYT